MAGNGPTIAHAWIGLTPSLSGSSAAIAAELGAVDTVTPGKKAGAKFSSGFKIGVLAMGAAVAVGLKSAITEASNLNESVNAVNVTFGEASAGVQQLGRDAAQAMGLSNVDFNALAVRFSAFSKTISGPGGDVTGTLQDITQRAADFASVMNLDVNDAAQLFQSGLAGEMEPLRRYGINLSAASLQAYAVAHGIAEQGKALTEEQRVQAAYGSLMEQTDKTQGDFANTSTELANASRILMADVKNLSAKLGTALLPVMKTLVGWGLKAVDWISANTDLIKPFAIVVGILALAMWALLSPWTLVAVAVAAVAAGLVWFFKKTEVGKKLLSAYVTAVKAYGGAFVWLWKNAIKPAVDGIVTAWNWLWKYAIGPTVALAQVYFAAIGAVFSWLWTNIISPVVGFIVAAINVWAAIVGWLWTNIVSPIFQAIGAIVGWLWTNIVSPVIGFIVAAIQVWIDIVGWLWTNIISPVFQAIGAIFSWVWNSVISPTIGFIMGAIRALGAVFSWLWENAISPAINFIKGSFEAVKAAFGAVKDFFSEKVDQIKAVFSGIAGAISGAFKTAFNKIVTFWNTSVGKLDFTMPSWMGGGHFAMPRMTPILDQGGIVTRPTIAALAVNSRPEAVIPLDKWDETVGRGGGITNNWEIHADAPDATAQAVLAAQRLALRAA